MSGNVSKTVAKHALLTAVLLSSCVPPAMAGQKRALLIGINDYLANDPGMASAEQHTWIPEDLKGALNDIALMRQVLVTRFGFVEQDIQSLENSAATRAAMLGTLEAFVAATRPDDIVYIHFSGHGSQVEDRNGDEPDGLDETILPYDARTGTVPDITDDELGLIFAGLPTPNSLIVLDSCHSGTATRGASTLKARAVPLDPRGEIYTARGEGAVPPLSANHILMTGAADYQSALDGPIDEGRYYGLFTLSLGRTLGRIEPGSAALDVHREIRREMERIGAEYGLFAVPEAQIEGTQARLAAGVLGEAATALARRDASRLAWATARPAGDEVHLEGAGTLATRPGALWAVYPPGETRFAPGAARALLVVDAVRAGVAVGHQQRPGGAIEAGSRAVPLAPAPPEGEVSILLDRVADGDRQALTDALQSVPGGQELRLVRGDECARFIVDRDGDQFTVYGAGGIQHVADIPVSDLRAAAGRLVTLARRSRKVTEILALDNPTSALRLGVEVNPVDRSGSVRGVAVVGAADATAYRVRRPGEPRDRSNSLMLEIEVSTDSYVTVVDVDPEGGVAVLFPNPVSERNGFLPAGFVPAGRAVRIPDALEDNLAGFYWDYVPPVGIDTLRVFAAGDPQTAQRIRDFLDQFSRAAARGGDGTPSRLDLYARTTQVATRGVATVTDESTVGDWVAASVTVVVEE